MLQRSNRLTQALFFCGLTTCVTATQATAAEIDGDWKVKDGTAIIRVADCGGTVWGAVVWEKIPGGRDTQNPDASKKNRPFLGLPILVEMKPGKKPGKWEGQIYNAKNGKNYESKIQLAKPDALEVEGCLMGFLCGGETWTRIQPLADSPLLADQTADDGAKAGAKGKAAPAKSAAKTAPKAAPKSAANNAAKTTGSTAPAAGEPVGDICLLPDIAGATH